MASELYAIYDEANGCAAALRTAGFIGDADALEGAMGGATSGEILSDLGFHLWRIIDRTEIQADLHERLEGLLPFAPAAEKNTRAVTTA